MIYGGPPFQEKWKENCDNLIGWRDAQFMSSGENVDYDENNLTDTDENMLQNILNHSQDSQGSQKSLK